MRRVLKCDGVIVETMTTAGEPGPATPNDVREIKAYVEANRTMTPPFDIVINGSTADLNTDQRREVLQEWQEAGTTWWIEGMWEASEDAVAERLRQGPPTPD